MKSKIMVQKGQIIITLEEKNGYWRWSGDWLVKQYVSAISALTAACRHGWVIL
jgi:hypothetical protein